MKNAGILIVLLFAFSPAIPAYPQEEKQKKWNDQAELSFVDTGGNTDVLSLSAKNLLRYAFDENLKGTWKFSALYGESGSVRNAESYSTEVRLDYLFTDRFCSAIIAG